MEKREGWKQGLNHYVLTLYALCVSLGASCICVFMPFSLMPCVRSFGFGVQVVDVLCSCSLVLVIDVCLSLMSISCLLCVVLCVM